MNPWVVEYIRKHPYIYQFLREDSSYYNLIFEDNRNIYQIKKLAMEKYKIRFGDKMDKMSNHISIIRSFLDLFS